LARTTEARDENVIGNDVELLLVLSLDVLGASCEAQDAGEARLGRLGDWLIVFGRRREERGRERQKVSKRKERE